MSKEIRAYSFECETRKDEQHGCHVVGRPIVFDSRTNLGSFDEIIDKAALDNADLKDVRFLINHNTDMIPLARSRNNNENSTMQMSINASGLDIRVNLDVENNTDARSLYSAIERGDITGMSFMFEVEEDSWEGINSDHPTRTIRAISKVYEVSAVTFPAYEQTNIQARGLAAALDSAKAELESLQAERRQNIAKLKLLLEVNNEN